MSISKPSVLNAAYTVHDVIGFDTMTTYLLDKAGAPGTSTI